MEKINDNEKYIYLLEKMKDYLRIRYFNHINMFCDYYNDHSYMFDELDILIVKEFYKKMRKQIMKEIENLDDEIMYVIEKNNKKIT